MEKYVAWTPMRSMGSAFGRYGTTMLIEQVMHRLNTMAVLPETRAALLTMVTQDEAVHAPAFESDVLIVSILSAAWRHR